MADVLSSYLDRLRAIEGIKIVQKGDEFRVSVTWQGEDSKTSLKQLRLIQTQLRLLKKEVAANAKAISQQYREAASGLTYQPGFGGALLGASYRGAQRRNAAANKARLAQNHAHELAPYERVKEIIDQVLMSLDVEKAKWGG